MDVPLLSVEIKRLVSREVGAMGEHILRKQCADNAIDPDDIHVEELGLLSRALFDAVKGFTGVEKAERVKRSVLKHKILRDLEGLEDRKLDVMKRRKKLEALAELGAVAKALGDYKGAVEHYEKALALSVEHKEERARAELLGLIGEVRWEMGEFGAASGHLEQAKTIAEAGGFQEELAFAHSVMGKVAWRNADMQSGIQCFYNSMIHYGKANDDRGLARAYLDLASIYGEMGKYPESEEYFEKSRALMRKIGDDRGLARLHNNHGALYSLRLEWAKAREEYIEAIRFSERSYDYDILGWALFNQAEALMFLEELDTAEQALVRSWDMISKVEDRLGMAGVKLRQGMLYRMKGDWESAEASFVESMGMLRELGVPKYLADCLVEYGVMKKEMRDFQGAQELFDEAIEIHNAVGNGEKVREIEALADLRDVL